MASNMTLISSPQLAVWWLSWRCTPHAQDGQGERPSIEAAIKVVEQRATALARFEGAYFETSAARHHAAIEVLQRALSEPDPPAPEPTPEPAQQPTPEPEPVEEEHSQHTEPSQPRQLALNLFDFPM